MPEFRNLLVRDLAGSVNAAQGPVVRQAVPGVIGHIVAELHRRCSVEILLRY